MLESKLHPVLAAAAEGRLPEWAECSDARREHALRVSRLLAEWARSLGLPRRERRRWAAAGTVHDALRDAAGEELRRMTEREWPLPLLHAPACAERLRREGVGDDALLRAVAYHPTGHSSFDRLGDALYAADFLEPGRPFLEERRAELRERMPGGLDEVRVEVIALRLQHLVRARKPLMPESLRYWNRCVAS